MYASASKVLDEQTAPEAEIAAATEVIRAAAFQGRPAAQARVGRWHLFGICGAPKDARAAVVLLHSAAVAGDRDGQYWLGVYFSKAEEFAGVGTAAGAAADEPAGMPGSSDAEVDPARRQTLAREVMAEIKAMRKVAKANKIRRVQGLPLLPLRGGEPGDFASSDASASVDGSSSAPASASAYASEDPTRVPLRSNVRRAHHWLMAAALQDHADAQVALGNLVMAHAQGAGRAAGLGDARQAIGWYELAAQVSHHSLPTTMATATATASVEDDADAGDADDAAAAGAAASAVSEVEAEAALLQPAAPNVSGAPPHPDALFNLGMIYHDGLPGVVPRDRIRAAQYFKRAAELFDPAALFWLGYCYHHGDAEAGIAPDGRQALRNFELAAGMGHPGAAHYLSRLYRNGETPQGAGAANKQRKAGGCGSGGCGSGGCSTASQQPAQTAESAVGASSGGGCGSGTCGTRSATSSGGDSSCGATTTADCEAAGCAPEKIADCESSGKISSTSSSSSSCSTAGASGGSCGTSGGGGCGSGGCGPKVRTGSVGLVGSGPLHLEADPARAAYFLGLAAEAGHAEAMFEVADAHYHGRLQELPPSLWAPSATTATTTTGDASGSPQPNIAAALRFYEDAAAAGHAEAAVCAGAIYFKGEGGVPRDPQRALALYTQAAQAGSAAGWENVAALLATGARGEDGSLVIPPNRETAAYIRSRILPSMATGSMKPAKSGAAAAAVSAQAVPAGTTAASATSSSTTPAAAASGATANAEADGEGEGVIRTSVYRASDPDVAAAATRRGSGDSPDDPIELDMSTGTAARVIEHLTRRSD